MVPFVLAATKSGAVSPNSRVMAPPFLSVRYTRRALNIKGVLSSVAFVTTPRVRLDPAAGAGRADPGPDGRRRATALRARRLRPHHHGSGRDGSGSRAEDGVQRVHHEERPPSSG